MSTYEINVDAVLIMSEIEADNEEEAIDKAIKEFWAREGLQQDLCDSSDFSVAWKEESE